MRRLMVFILPLALLVGPIPAQGAGVALPTRPSVVDGAAPHRVTLITGDVVTFLDGKDFVVDPAPRPDGRQVTFTGRTGDTIAGVRDFYVLPSDVEGDRRLDRELFNITGLVREGLDHASTTPVLVQDATVRAPRAFGAAKTDGHGQFLRGLGQQAKVWLNHKRKVSLDYSVPQIGAPAAWGAGLDGTGITVAVIDTGIDSSHPDLADRVIAAQNFTEDPDAADLYGHGTHVASTIAGRGTPYRGVAPGAKLINAKACDGSGSCYDSWLIDAMNYAAHSGAQVINMSVGGGVSDGNDPLSLELDRLTAETGALFVVAAGNAGEFGPVTVGSPGAARSALTVGAVDRQDKLAYFSSRGPRYGDAGIKPDLTAPGVGIVAARAADTAMGTPVNDLYTASNGTSMATPHVAGAAAILAQQHPEWKAGRLKDVLVSTALETPGSVTEIGSGRVDVSRAYQAKAFGPSTVDFGQIKRHTVKLKKLTYHNDSDLPVRFNLRLTGTGWNGRPLAPGSVILSPLVVVPAHGAADAFLLVNTFTGDNGSFSGLITATADGMSLRTPFSYYVIAPVHQLTVPVLDRHGSAVPTANVTIMRDDFDPVSNNDPFAQLFYDGAEAVPAGSYSVMTALYETSLTARARFTTLSKVDVRVSRPTTVTLDARAAVPVNASSSDADVRVHNVSFSRSVRGGAAMVLGCSCAQADAFATPTPAPRFGVLSLQDTWTFAERTVSASSGGTALKPLHDPYRIASKFPGQSTQPVVWAKDGSDFTGIDVAGKVALVGLPADNVYGAGYNAARNALAAGARGLATYVEAPGALAVANTHPDIAYLGLSQAEGLAVRAAATLDLTTKPNPGYIYNLHYSQPNGVPSSLTHIVNRADLKLVESEYHADLPGLKASRAWIAFRKDVAATMLTPVIYLQAPAKVSEYVGGSGDVFTNVGWTRNATLTDTSRNQITMYNRKPFASKDIWFSGPSSPGGFDPHNRAFFRYSLPGQPQVFSPSLYMGDGSDGHLLDTSYFGYRATTYRLFRGGSEIPPQHSPYSPVPTFAVPNEDSLYRLEATTVLPLSGPGGPTQAIRRLSRSVDTTWTFHSGRNAPAQCFYGSPFECQDESLLQPFYDLRLGLLNTAPAGQAHTISVSIASTSGKQLTLAGLTVAYSVDEGATWQQAVMSGSQATIQNPASGHVWLRTEAWTTTGDRVTQTVHRIYSVP